MARLLSYWESLSWGAHGQAVASGLEEMEQIVQSTDGPHKLFKAFILGDGILAGDVYIDGVNLDGLHFGFVGTLKRIGR